MIKNLTNLKNDLHTGCIGVIVYICQFLLQLIILLYFSGKLWGSDTGAIISKMIFIKFGAFSEVQSYSGNSQTIWLFLQRPDLKLTQFNSKFIN